MGVGTLIFRIYSFDSTFIYFIKISRPFQEIQFNILFHCIHDIRYDAAKKKRL